MANTKRNSLIIGITNKQEEEMKSFKYSETTKNAYISAPLQWG